MLETSFISHFAKVERPEMVLIGIRQNTKDRLAVLCNNTTILHFLSLIIYGVRIRYA